METRLRLLLVLAGLPPPEPQLIVRDLEQNFVARADLGYPAELLIIEYDGAWHWKQRRADDRRRDAMRELRWEVIVVSSDDFYETPAAVVAKVRRALAGRAGLAGAAARQSSSSASSAYSSSSEESEDSDSPEL
jgi:hypothetical protein